MKLKELFNQDKPVLESTVWDVTSVKLAEKNGFQLVGTQSSVFADMLGYEDGRDMYFPQLKMVLERIGKNTNLPFVVDMEFGYSEDVMEVVENLKELSRIGVAGVNLEDSRIIGEPRLVDAKENAENIRTIKRELEKENIDMFINVRTDAYYLGFFFGVKLDNPLEETLNRIKIYEEAGADGIFVPLVPGSKEIKEITNATNLPLTVLGDTDNLNLEELGKLGVKRVCLGNALYLNAMKHHEDKLMHMKNQM